MANGTGDNSYKFYKVVLTGGPCGGKTTGQARLSTFFENLGWKVYRAPESAYIYLSGGACFADMNSDEAFSFQENIIRTMMQVENTFHDLAKDRCQNVMLICDRGIMDGSAYLPRKDWERMKANNGWHEVDLRDNRYNQIIHMVSAAKGAEDFYSLAGHKTRHEGLDSAREIDTITANAWVGHPYFDIIDNCTGFEAKISKMISAVCTRIGIDLGDRLAPNSIKRKYLVTHIPDVSEFPHHQEFSVVHDYLVTPSRKMQARLRKRGQEGNWTYTHTIRRPEINEESVELRMPVTEKDYEILLAQRDDKHHTVYKIRRCFLWQNQYFQLDIYQSPCPDKCQGLMLLETFTAQDRDALTLPDFITIQGEVTGDPRYSMFNLSLKEQFWASRDTVDQMEDD
ncbi:TRPL translocation defect protein 14-like [Babylonia areolata]|uniref:TRPL translocation defect protein 14-like n=1 Tax=Babylonia areolata TaxID=304850 RepID=UPI003FD0CA85